MKFGKFRINQTTGIALVCVFILLGMMLCNNRTPQYYEGVENKENKDKKNTDDAASALVKQLEKVDFGSK